MQCRVVKDAHGNIVAASPLSSSGDPTFELQLEKGEMAVEVDVPDESMRDADAFLHACRTRLDREEFEAP